ncbi:hypothetical protein MPNT_50055 [Candidatus Methylacidithermus pantelleriae]|uniref:Uncharacterized protein n=1 Tax=Candidatus Methylacidithermus pantelleriae TaxID=2744239 RepID=A0A8J2BVI2_9BACT|nr:hypothetical protein MPNT_50055 [Candidatus Methylacidithermus pantelleriae]
MRFDKRAYAFEDKTVMLYRIDGGITVSLRLDDYPKRIVTSGRPKGPDGVFRERMWCP